MECKERHEKEEVELACTDRKEALVEIAAIDCKTVVGVGEKAFLLSLPQLSLYLVVS